MTNRYRGRRAVRLIFASGLFGIATYAARAQQAASIPIRAVTILASTDSGVVQVVSVLHPQSDGRVLLNDAVAHQLLLFDSTLKTFKVIADTAGRAPNTFGSDIGGLLFFAGDSAAWVDHASRALVVVDANGKFGRVTTPPRIADIPYLTGRMASGVPGFDGRGRLYYRGPVRSQAPPGMTHDTVLATSGLAPIVRADLDVRRLDTIAMVRVPVNRQRMHPREGKNPDYTFILDPVSITDEWAYFRDGTVAVVRGQDYHIDWFFADGTRKSTPKMPFDWRRFTESDKQRLVDSLAHMIDTMYAGQLARVAAMNKRVPPGSPQAYAPPKPEIAPTAGMPDYYPAVQPSSQVRVDLDDNLWILPSTSSQAKGGVLYDVVNRKGEIVERVQLPGGRNLQGFGPGGIIYLSVPAQYGWPRVERARIERHHALS